jgi:long-chain acyl-CoA synthetase
MNSFETVQSIVDGLPSWQDRSAILSFQKDTVKSWSYSQLSQDIERLARGLRRAGTGKSDYVVLLAPPGPEWIIACLAAVRAGAVAVPLDAQLDDQTLQNILAEIDAKFVCTTRDKAARLKEIILGTKSRIVLLDDQEDHLSWRRLATEDNAELPAVRSTDEVALFFTSGTMGPPKGVPLSHGNIAFQINAVIEEHILGPDDSVLAPLPLHHIYPFVIEMLYPLALGLPIVMPESLTGPQLTRAIRDGRVTAIVGVPRLYKALVSIIKERARSEPATALLFQFMLGLSILMRRYLGVYLGKFLFAPVHRQLGPHLRLLACGGAALDSDLAWDLEGLGWTLAVGYGLTETSPLLSIKLPGQGKLNSVGRVLPGVELRIDKPKSLSQLELHQRSEGATGTHIQVGEIIARGPGVFSGYRNLPQKNAEAFTEDGWFRTGDLGYFDGSDLHVLGRISALIVGEAGEKIDPEQLEDHYMENPVIKEIGVLQRSGKLAAIVVPDLKQIALRGGGDVDRLVHDAIDERSVHLPRYKRLSGIVLSADLLPRTPMGKIQRHKLQARFDLMQNGTRHQNALTWQDLPAADQSIFEHPVAQSLWQYLVDRYQGMRLSLDTSLQLELGIDSLDWVSLTLDMRERMGIDLDESAIVRISTVRDLLAEVVRLSQAGTIPSTCDALAEPEKSLSTEQRRWLEPLRPMQVLGQLGLYAFDKGLVQILFRPRVIGLENIPQDVPVVFIPNHASYVDGFVLAAALPYSRLRQLQWTGWTGISFANSFVRGLARLLRGIPIDPDRAVLSSLALAAAVLKAEQSLTWFPEGRRTLTGELQPFKGGIGILLEHFPGALVVPVFLKDTGKALAPGSWIIHPVKLEVIFGEPKSAFDLQQDGAGDSPRERIVSALHQAVWQLDPNNQLAAAKDPLLQKAIAKAEDQNIFIA